MKKIFSFLLAFIFLTGILHSTNYYVSNAGNNSNTGTTLPLAWATLQYAANNVAPGDCVLVANGTYVGCYISTSGTSGNPIIFKALGNSAVINQPNATTNDGINVENCDWIVIDGFRVINQPRTGIRVVLANNCVVRNNFCDNNSRWGILTGFAEDIIIEYNECSNSQIEHGIYFSNSADNPVIRYNTSHHNNANGIHMNGDISMGGDGIITNARVEGNIIYENGANGGSGINCDGVSNSLILNNLLYENHASGISLYMIDAGAGASNNKVYNNTIINASDARWCVNITDASTGNSIFNNILINQHPTRGSITIDATSLTGFTSDNNIVVNRFSNDGDNTTITLAAWQAAGGYDSNSLIAAAQTSIFQNPTGFDYHLLAASQAIDSGSSSVSAFVLNDLELNTRPWGSGYDIGCYEFYGRWGSTSEITDFGNSIFVYPNPFSETTVLRITNPSELRISDIKIFDVLGKEIHTEIIRNSYSFVIRSGELTNGIYFLKVGNSTKKIIVQK